MGVEKIVNGKGDRVKKGRQKGTGREKGTGTPPLNLVNAGTDDYRIIP